MSKATFLMIKPDIFERGMVGQVLGMVESLGIARGLGILHLETKVLTREGTEGFYAIHRNKPFFRELVEFISSGMVMGIVLEGEDAVQKGREIVNKVREIYADPVNKTRNAIHGSDSPENAEAEIKFMFVGD